MRYLAYDRFRIAHNCRLDDLLRVVRGVRARAAAVPPVGGPIGGAGTLGRAAQEADGVLLGLMVWLSLPNSARDEYGSN